MANIKFFSNDLVFVDGKEGEIVTSLAGTRTGSQSVFTTPDHTIDTPNLLIFVDGKIQIRDRDYMDRNSHEIEFVNPILESQDFMAILMRAKVETSAGSSNLEWQDF